jgi:hypothetical protein
MFDLETIIAMNAPKGTRGNYHEAWAKQDAKDQAKLHAVPEVFTPSQTATYRIHTEDVNRPTILKLAGFRFEGFTVTYGAGFWRGEAEDTLILEIITADSASVYLLAEEIRKANKQESVIVNRAGIERGVGRAGRADLAINHGANVLVLGGLPLLTIQSSVTVEAESPERAVAVIEGGQFNQFEPQIDYSYGEPVPGTAEVIDAMQD